MLELMMLLSLKNSMMLRTNSKAILCHKMLILGFKPISFKQRSYTLTIDKYYLCIIIIIYNDVVLYTMDDNQMSCMIHQVAILHVAMFLI